MQTKQRGMWLGTLVRSCHQLSMTYGIDELRFETAYWYKDVDLLALEALYGEAFMQKIYFHIMVFEASKLVSVRMCLTPLLLIPILFMVALNTNIG